jgi:hypothetical protein
LPGASDHAGGATTSDRLGRASRERAQSCRAAPCASNAAAPGPADKSVALDDYERSGGSRSRDARSRADPTLSSSIVHAGGEMGAAQAPAPGREHRVRYRCGRSREVPPPVDARPLPSGVRSSTTSGRAARRSSGAGASLPVCALSRSCGTSTLISCGQVGILAFGVQDAPEVPRRALRWPGRVDA